MRNGKRFKCTFFNAYSPSTNIYIRKGGYMSLGNHVSALNDVTISVGGGAKLKLGENVNINKGCSIISKESVEIGDYVLFGPNCGVYDHDHNYKFTGRKRQENFVTGKVKIGNGVWFGANCIVLKDTVIGDNCVFGAGCIIKGEYPDNSLVVPNRDSYCKIIECI